MAEITFHNETTVHTNGELPAVGASAPAFEVLGSDLAPISLSDFAGKNLILNIFPSIDTGVCATSVRTFNKEAAALENTVVLCVSNDLPFALSRFCGAEGIENVVTSSAFRSSFGADYGVLMEDGPLAALLARAVVVINPAGEVVHAELVSELTNEPNYEAAKAAIA
ncbi:MAG: thiol peroxidase [Rothia sp. (in: high G+C Gram-positive bacteria)]|uniref:thiol peroxidase n=1 Tax=Rothia sp. (in: high G+C Gram-positive bacteria) TaxID=1885016 RepID=UPI0026E00EFB|nr:thiol peroxidase [Rothia sp. (in: high G+C Gram-positive bacteria)]MDO5750065.1 thiol peroxidase [Rothia sp. (in: high G+C Gram-positive bacteria)]